MKEGFPLDELEPEYIDAWPPAMNGDDLYTPLLD